jgi:hypothetical protein
VVDMRAPAEISASFQQIRFNKDNMWQMRCLHFHSLHFHNLHFHGLHFHEDVEVKSKNKSANFDFAKIAPLVKYYRFFTGIFHGV